MRESRVARQFVSRPDVIRDAERNGWRGVIFREHHAQTVFQRGLLDGKFYFPRGGFGACGFVLRHCRDRNGRNSQRHGKPGSREDSDTVHVVLRPNVFLTDSLSYVQ